jgi:integrase
MEQRKYLTEEEFARFLGAVRGEKDAHERARNVAIFTVMYWRGLRASEIGKLQLSSWRQKAGSLYVVRAKGSLSGEYLLSPPEARALKAWARERGGSPVRCFPRGTEQESAARCSIC